MLESVIIMLITVCVIAVAVYLVLWVLEAIGVTLPPKVVQILWVIVVLIVVLLLMRTFLPLIGVRL